MGERHLAAKYNWESFREVAERAYHALYKYENAKKIIVVCHGVVIRQFVYADYIPHCGILETEFDRNFQWKGFNLSARNIYNNSVFLATEQDIGGWMELVELVKDDFPGLETDSYIQVLRENIRSKTALCYISDGKIIGILLFSPEQSCLSFMAVHPGYRKKGIATALIHKMLNLMPDGDIFVTTYREGDEKGTAARALYKRNGFEEAELFTEFDYPVQKFVLRRK
jgi:ribosomal protein S18 acetylase RimI-like enzyme